VGYGRKALKRRWFSAFFLTVEGRGDLEGWGEDARLSLLGGVWRRAGIACGEKGVFRE
jgi:hypothetical protein